MGMIPGSPLALARPAPWGAVRAGEGHAEPARGEIFQDEGQARQDPI